MSESSAEGKRPRPASRRREREAGGRRSNRFLVSYNDDESAVVRAAADRDNQALASWVGSVAMDVAEEVLVPTPVNAKAVVRELIEAHKQLRRVGTNHNQITKVWNSDGRVPDAQMEAVYRALLIAIQRVEAATLQLMRERKERE